MSEVDSSTDFAETIYNILEDVVIDALVPTFQSLVPGSSNSIWASTSFVWILLATFTFIIYCYYRWWMK